MEKIKERIDFEKRQYHAQANLAYVSSFFILLFVFIPLMIVVGNPPLIITTLVSLFISFLALYLNRKYHYRLASFLFIGMVSLQATLQIIVFGKGLGFIFYFFTICMLIFYAKWRGNTRFFVIVGEGLLAIGLIVFSQFNSPLVVLSDEFSLLFLLINFILNITGVINSANFYMGIVGKARKNLEVIALHDYLTGLPNRAALSNFTENHVCLRKDNSISSNYGVLLIDIDFFKRVNDTFGHLMGDMVLKQTALLLLQQTKENDFVCRYGGEEFLMVIDTSSPQELALLAESIRKEFEDFVFTHRLEQCRITISIGAVFQTCEDQLDFTREVEKADAALYLAKQNGRNCVFMNNEHL